MGRSRAAAHAAVDEDSGQSRSKRKRTNQNVENVENVIPVPGLTDGKKALYHCNYCNKDISGKIRIKCAICSDFDLCVECFSVGTEVYPHKSNHPYRVMDNLAFPLICADWNADEEMLLLEGIGMYGFGNWNEVAEHVGTKSKSQCIDHYSTTYMNSPCFPLPDMSHVMGKNREELLAMAKDHSEVKKGATSTSSGEADVKGESLFPTRIKVEDLRKEGPAGPSSSSISSEVVTTGGAGCGKMSAGAGKRASSTVPSNNDLNSIKLEDRSIGEKKPRNSGDEGLSLKELSGYNAKRQEFEIEYDNDAEQLLADMEFKETDTDAEHALKLRVLHIYARRLDERKRRKDFILERNLLYPDPFEKTLTTEEKELCCQYRVFMRFHSKEEHEELLRSVVEEHRILKKIKELQEARAAGCRTSAEAERYMEHKRKKEMEENARRAKESTQAGPSGKYLQRLNHQKGEQDSSPGVGQRSPTGSDTSEKDSSITNRRLAGSNVSENWDVTGHAAADLLSEAEKQLCGEIRIIPMHYLNMQETMSMGILKGTITKKSDAHGLFNVDPVKVDKVYDMLIQKGIAET